MDRGTGQKGHNMNTENENTDESETKEAKPVKPTPIEIESIETDVAVTEAPTSTWDKILGTGKRRKYTLGIGIGVPVAIVLGALFWFTRDMRGWTGNLIIFSIPLLVVLTYVFDHYAQDRFWTEYAESKLLRFENRQDAAIILPVIMFMGVLSLNSDMDWFDATVHYFRFVLLATLVWSGLIWLTRRVPPIRKKTEER